METAFTAATLAGLWGQASALWVTLSPLVFLVGALALVQAVVHFGVRSFRRMAGLVADEQARYAYQEGYRYSVMDSRSQLSRQEARRRVRERLRASR